MAVEALSKIAKVDYKKYGHDMIKAGSSLDGMTKEQVLYKDYKNYTIDNQRVGLGQVITMDIKEVLNEKDEYIYKTLRVDFKGHVLYIDDKEVKVTLKEYELLKYLLDNENIALSRDKILNNVWNYDYYGDSRTIDSHIKKIRHKLGKKGKYIETIRGIGYKFEIKK